MRDHRFCQLNAKIGRRLEEAGSRNAHHTLWGHGGCSCERALDFRFSYDGFLCDLKSHCVSDVRVARDVFMFPLWLSSSRFNFRVYCARWLCGDLLTSPLSALFS